MVFKVKGLALNNLTKEFIMNDLKSAMKNAIKIKANQDSLRFELTTNFSASAVILKSAIGTLEIMGGWQHISENDGFNNNELRDTLILNIEHSLNNVVFVNENNDNTYIENIDIYFDGVFTDLRLDDIKCTKLDEEGRYGEITINITVEDHLRLNKFIGAYRDIGRRPVF